MVDKTTPPVTIPATARSAGDDVLFFLEIAAVLAMLVVAFLVR